METEHLFLLLIGYAIATTMILTIWAGRRTMAAPATVVLQNGTEVDDGSCLVPLVLLAVVTVIILVMLGI